MTTLLRKVRQSRWRDVPRWLLPTDAPAPTLADLDAAEHALSLWLIDGTETNLDRVVCALASACDYLSPVDVVRFPVDVVIETLGRAPASTPGRCADKFAANNWHRDVECVTAAEVARLAQAIFRHEDRQLHRFREGEVRALLLRGLREDWLKAEDLRPKLRADLEI